MTVHYDREAPGQARVPVNVARCGVTVKPGDTATAASAWITCAACEAVGA